MERMIDLKEISDGRLYTADDMVKADCQDCKGCSACCRGMGSSIILDPYDIYQLELGLHLSFEELLAGYLELNVAEGIVLPNLRLDGPEEKCRFNNDEGRCSIHEFRPGICRLFPLGRFYEDGSFRYYLQIHECKKTNRSKIKVKKWLQIPNLPAYEAFICHWHYFLKEISAKLAENTDDAAARTCSLTLLKIFFLTPWDTAQDFYAQWEARMAQAEPLIAGLLP